MKDYRRSRVSAHQLVREFDDVCEPYYTLEEIREIVLKRIRLRK